jgi:putative membrane protein
VDTQLTRAGLVSVAVTAVLIVIGGCSKTEGTKTPVAEQPGARPPAVGTGGAGADVKTDGEFVNDVAIKNLSEIELSRMALDKATTADLKAFAQKTIDIHGTAANQLKNALSGFSLEWPAQLDDKHRKTADELANKHGADFDREYAKAMVEGHQDLAAKLESRLDVQSLSDWKTAAAGRTQGKALPDPKTEMRDVEVRPSKSDNDLTMKINQWAAETYSVVQKHLDTARTLENATKKRMTN